MHQARPAHDLATVTIFRCHRQGEGGGVGVSVGVHESVQVIKCWDAAARVLKLTKSDPGVEMIIGLWQTVAYCCGVVPNSHHPIITNANVEPTSYYSRQARPSSRKGGLFLARVVLQWNTHGLHQLSRLTHVTPAKPHNANAPDFPSSPR